MKYCLIVIILFLSGCIYDPPDSGLKVINNTDQKLGIVLRVDTIPSLSGYGAPFYAKMDLLSNDTLELIKPANSWVQLMRRHRKNNLYLFILDQNSGIGYNNHELGKEKRYKVISYTEKELDKLNWQINIDDKVVVVGD